MKENEHLRRAVTNPKERIFILQTNIRELKEENKKNSRKQQEKGS